MSAFAIWFPNIPVGVFSALLAVLGAIVSIIEFKGLTRVALVSAFLLLGAAEIMVIIKADSAHATEVENQHTDLENLRGELRKSDVNRQVDEAYLKAKLEDSYQMYSQLAQFAPALMKLAQTSADFERKQFEAKVATNKELRDFTMDLVSKIRQFSQKYELLQRQQIDALMNGVRQPQLSDAERQQRWSQETQKEIQVYYTRDSEFRTSILPDALYAINEFRQRKVPEPVLTPMEKSNVDMVFRGVLAGPYPELALADYLELMTKQLQLK